MPNLVSPCYTDRFDRGFGGNRNRSMFFFFNRLTASRIKKKTGGEGIQYIIIVQ